MRFGSLILALAVANGAVAASLSRRANCLTLPVEAGNGCAQLATRCGITTDELVEYNSHHDSLCTSLNIGQRVCCTPGNFPGMPGNPDGTCKTVQVDHGDNCQKLARECGVSVGELIELNNGDHDFCVTALYKGDNVCCTEGRLPKGGGGGGSPSGKGPCPTHVVKERDTCTSIAKNNGLVSWQELERLNKGKTWGWTNCNSLVPGSVICVGQGDAPTPF